MPEAVRPSPPEIRERLEFETLISDVSASLLVAPPERLHLAVVRALTRVRAFFGADRCILLSVSADQKMVKARLASYAEGVLQVPEDLDLVETFPWSRETLLARRAPVRIAKMADLPPEADVERAGWELMSIRSALTLPIETGGGALHLILLNTVHQEREWPDAFVTRLRVLGEMLVGALERQEMFAGLRDAEARVSLAADAAEAVRTNEGRLAAGAKLAGLGYYEIDYGAGSTNADQGFRDLCGIPPEREHALQPVEFWLAHLHPDDRERVEESRRQLHDGRQEQVSVEYRYLHPGHGEVWIHHLAGVTSRDAEGRVVHTYGVLRDVTTRKQAEDEMRGLSRRLIRAQEQERALLARELHDDVTQRLAVMAIDVGRAELAAPDGTQAESMRAVREGLVRMSEDIHALAYQLHPSVLEELGLAEALRAECERRERQSRIGLSVACDPLPPVVDKDVALCLFRVAQEALSNVVRHAEARTASVVLRPMDDGLLLAVSDDGTGFDPATSRKGKHLGLASMRERVSLVHGTLDIESAPGRGTAVVAWVPVEGAAR